MATVSGTSGSDFIHVSGDGLALPLGYTDNPRATNFDDVIVSGAGGDDIILAGGGNDTIRFSADLTGADRIVGGEGLDTLIIGDQSDVSFKANSLNSIERIYLPSVLLPVGFAGFQNLKMNDGNVAAGQHMTIDALGLSADTFFTFNGAAETNGTFTILGGAGGDTLRGGALGDGINGGSGNDLLIGGGGDDLLIGNLGSDALRGGAGADQLDGGDADASADTLDGGDGDDALSGFAGDDLLMGGAGGDSHFGGDGFDTASYRTAIADVRADLGTPSSNAGDAAGDSYFSVENLIGSRFDDLLAGNTGMNVIDGGDGADSLYGNQGHDVLRGGSGNDYLDGSFGLDSLYGGEGNDLLRGLADNDSLDGGVGNDVLLGDAGGDALSGGSIGRTGAGGGIDSASYATAKAGVAASLSNPAANTGDAAGDSYFSIENLSGSAFDDTLTGNFGSNTIQGGDGIDHLFGMNGDDVLLGSLGLVGSADVDTDFFDGGDGIDAASYKFAAAGVTADLADQFANTGAATDDRYVSIEDLTGSGFGDILRGDNLANRLDGGAGNDTLAAGAGADTLTGKAGADRFDFNRITDSGPGAATRDTVGDFQQGRDLLDLSTIDANTMIGGNQTFNFIGAAAFNAPGQVRAVQAGSNTIVQVSNDGDINPDMAIILTGVIMLSSGDFLL